MNNQYTRFSFDQIKLLNSKLNNYISQWDNELRAFEKSAAILCESWKGKAGTEFRSNLPKLISGYKNLSEILSDYTAFLDTAAEKYSDAELAAKNIASRLD